MDNDNVIEMPVKKNVLGGTVHIFKTKEQMEELKKQKEEAHATKKDSD